MRWWIDTCVLLFIVMAMRQRKRHSLGQQRGKKRRRYRRRQQHGRGFSLKGFTPFKFYNKRWYDDMKRGFGLRSGARKSLGLI